MTTPLHTQAEQLETALRDASRATGNPAYAALAIQVQAVADRLKDIEPRPVETAGTKYRMLTPLKDIFQEGDQIRDKGKDNWQPVIISIGFTFGSHFEGRRPIIPAEEFQVLTEFHQKTVSEQKEEK